MNETGLQVELDGANSSLVGKDTVQSTPIKYEHGRYYFDICAPAMKKGIRKHNINNDMEVDEIDKLKTRMSNNQFWVLGTDSNEEGF